MFFDIGAAMCRFGQMTAWVEEVFGMDCLHLVEPCRRPYDHTLWQLDLYVTHDEARTLSQGCMH